MSMGRTIFGVVVTAVWLLLAAIGLYCKSHELPGMDLNQWGDFAAGVFAAVAIVWLILGYFQQNEDIRLQHEELKQNTKELTLQTEALRLQQDEQRQTTEAMRDLVTATR